MLRGEFYNYSENKKLGGSVMFCPQCGKNIKDGVKFCGNCGWAIPNAPAQFTQAAEQRCASCGTVLKEGAKFCPNCGAQVSAAQSVPEPVTRDTEIATKKTGVSKPKSKKTTIDKAVFYHVEKQVYACYLYKDGTVVGNMTDTHGSFIPDVKEWLEEKYDNLVVEIK
jgi:RNA polymerase subunit RPABC4/transcription elongation factor Spt4